MDPLKFNLKNFVFYKVPFTCKNILFLDFFLRKNFNKYKVKAA